MIDYLFKPTLFSENELEIVGVKIIDKESRRCVCTLCEEEWEVDESDENGKLPGEFWQCPNLCNVLSLRIRSTGCDIVLWELPDGIPLVGKLDENEQVEIFELEPVSGDLYDRLKENMEEVSNAIATGLDWDIYENSDGTVYVAENHDSGIYILKQASEEMVKIYKKGKDNQFSVAGDLGMHT